jgi:hypothetical protein
MAFVSLSLSKIEVTLGVSVHAADAVWRGVRLLSKAISGALTGRSSPVPGKYDTSLSGDH